MIKRLVLRVLGLYLLFAVVGRFVEEKVLRNAAAALIAGATSRG